ncbi:MAG: CDP-glycerol glycerophosphotransferase family protein, partial [Candidatus Tenebribacter burtonii]|nr:CDP-glycerol glycerophosphotransferase family protein [Candidatus Tenebribacter burtonii]
GGEAYIFNSLKALYFGLIAKVYIHSYGRDDILNYSLKNAIFINLYHGMVIKKLKKYYRKDDLDIASSDFFIQVRRNIFPEIKKIAVTGEPRYDIFFSKVNKVRILKKYHLERYIDKKIISYLPTHRKYRDTYKPLFQEFKNIIKLKDVIIFDKSHPREKNLAKDIFPNYNNVVNISDLYIDTQELLSITNILITDYSSCFVDFILTERPVIFYAYDLKEFTEKNGFYVDYKKNVPGKICYNENELYNCIQAYLKYPELDYRKRIQGKKRFHKYYDGNSSERVYQEIMKLLN